jgi:hypothetical protein
MASEKLLPYIAGLSWPGKMPSFMTRELRLILTMASEKLLPHSWAVLTSLEDQLYDETTQVNIDHYLSKTVTS